MQQKKSLVSAKSNDTDYIRALVAGAPPKRNTEFKHANQIYVNKQNQQKKGTFLNAQSSSPQKTQKAITPISQRPNTASRQLAV